MIAHLRSLDERYPPGTLTSATALDLLIDYWNHATPRVPETQRHTAARLTAAALRSLPGAAVSTRSGGAAGYTTLRALDGRVATAIEAKGAHVDLSFPLPEPVAHQLRDAGLVRIWQPRGYSLWCQTGVGATLQLDQATQLLRTGLRYEFGDA